MRKTYIFIIELAFFTYLIYSLNRVRAEPEPTGGEGGSSGEEKPAEEKPEEEKPEEGKPGGEKGITYYFTGKTSTGEGEMGMTQYIVIGGFLILVVLIIVGIVIGMKRKH